MSIIQSMYGNDHEYNINGATYIVSAAFKHRSKLMLALLLYTVDYQEMTELKARVIPSARKRNC